MSFCISQDGNGLSGGNGLKNGLGLFCEKWVCLGYFGGVLRVLGGGLRGFRGWNSGLWTGWEEAGHAIQRGGERAGCPFHYGFRERIGFGRVWAYQS
jgi:hypothetical protein